jgi:hypothetical protein
MKLDGSDVQQVTTGEAYNWASDWSPTGNDLVFVRESLADPTDTDVWMAHSDGSGEQQVTTDGADRPEAFPTWSPDGRKVVFGGIVATGEYNVFSVDPLTGDEENLIDADPPNSWSVAYPTWQPLGHGGLQTRVNLAQGRPITSSNAYPGNAAALAVDGDWFSYWSAGNFPPQWIEIDLGSAQRVDEVNLGITQLPDCQTVHRLSARQTATEPYTLLHEFSGFTIDQQNLRHVLSVPTKLRYVRVETTSSCSWVGWREVEVYSPDS